MKVKGGYLDEIDEDKIEIDREGAYSLTFGKDNLTLCNFIAQMFHTHTLTITDACAACGGDSMQFLASGVFQHVNSVEYNATRADYLEHNMKLVQESVLGDNTYQVFSQSYLDVMTLLRQDVVYFDPPWGGVNYRQHDVALGLGGMSISDIVQRLKDHSLCTMVVIKAPFNWRDVEIRSLTAMCEKVHVLKCKKYSFHVGILNKYMV